MCGFSGIIANVDIQGQTILDSIASIKHRGPDDSLILTGNRQFYSFHLSNSVTRENFPPLPLEIKSPQLFAFNRLSIVDLSQNAMQPFFDPEKELVFMLNGEIYNYMELRQEFLSTENFISNSDSEVAFRLFLKLGDEFIHHLRGMFSIVVYDFKSGELKAWRDRLGMKPFYYTLNEGTFVFSSEMKGIFATKVLEKQINYQGLAYSMYLGTCPSPLTIFNGIHSLQAGCQLSYSLNTGELSTSHYWHLKYEPSKRTIDFEEFNTDLEQLCRLHKTGDVEKALMLSGGMDSGALAYYFGKIDRALKCLNIYTDNHSIDEREYAQINASNAGLQLTFLEIPGSPKENQIQECLQAEEEPNSVPEPAVFLCEKAKEMGFDVLFSALGPDELFGGYSYFSTIHKFRNLYKFLKFIPGALIPKKYRSKFMEVKMFGFEYYPLTCRKVFTWEEIRLFLQKKGEPIPLHPIEYLKCQVNDLYPGFKNLPLLKKVSYLEIFYNISSHHTFRSDQPSMRYSIEMRFPFLDHLFIEKYFNQADTFEKMGLYLKPRFKDYVGNILPKKIFEMKKKGFSMPTERWISTVLENKHPEISPANSVQRWYLRMLREVES